MRHMSKAHAQPVLFARPYVPPSQTSGLPCSAEQPGRADETRVSIYYR